MRDRRIGRVVPVYICWSSRVDDGDAVSWNPSIRDIAADVNAMELAEL